MIHSVAVLLGPDVMYGVGPVVFSVLAVSPLAVLGGIIFWTLP